MPSIAEAPISPTCKKRRREDGVNGAELQMRMNSHHLQRHELNHDPSRRNILHAKSKRLHDTKRQRISSSSEDHVLFHADYLHDQPDTRDAYHSLSPRKDSASYASPKFSGKVDLSACHICRRKPTLRNELDSYADCEACGERTCYICIRECDGLGLIQHPTSRNNVNWSDLMMMERGNASEGKENGDVERRWEKRRVGGHRGMVCSRCCVEKGAEGEVWCFGCLRAAEGG